MIERRKEASGLLSVFGLPGSRGGRGLLIGGDSLGLIIGRRQVVLGRGHGPFGAQGFEILGLGAGLGLGVIVFLANSAEGAPGCSRA